MSKRLLIWLLRSPAIKARRLAAKRVAKAFDGVEWQRNVFIVGGITTAVGGETQFYKAGEIDRAIGRLNIVLKDLSA